MSETPKTNPAETPNTVLYDRLVERTREIYEQGKDRSHEAWEHAMEASREQLTAAGEFSADQGERFKLYMRRDLDQTIEDMQQLGEGAKERLHPARLGAGALSSFSRLLNAAGAAMTAMSRKAEGALQYETGEITMAGTLTCVACAKTLVLHETAVVPTCPACGATRFRKSY